MWNSFLDKLLGFCGTWWHWYAKVTYLPFLILSLFGDPIQNYSFNHTAFSNIVQVTDYARDLEEMQMVSKEDYLVSLRRHGSLDSFVTVFLCILLHVFLFWVGMSRALEAISSFDDKLLLKRARIGGKLGHLKTFSNTIIFLFYRKSSAFSRGFPKYRGLSRYALIMVCIATFLCQTQLGAHYILVLYIMTIFACLLNCMSGPFMLNNSGLWSDHVTYGYLLGFVHGVL